MTGLALDVRLALRGLARRRWAMAAAVMSLGLGMAAQIVVLSCVNAVLWKPLPVPEPERVVTVYAHNRMLGKLANISWPQLARLETLEAFDSVAAFTRFPLWWDSGHGAEQVNVEMVTENYFDVLRPPFELGEAPRVAGEAALGHDFWRSRFGGARDAVGQTIRLAGEQYRITGVMARPFRGTLLDYYGNPKVWFTLSSQSRLPFLRDHDLVTDWGMALFIGVGRLRPGVSSGQAQQAVSAMEKHAGIPAAAPGEARVFAAARSTFYPGAREKVTRTLAWCVAAGGLLLFLGCLNAALFLAGKAHAEARQAAIEGALGAGSLRIAGRRFLEAGLLGGMALATGTAFASWWMRLLASYPPPLSAIVLEPAWDWRVWALTAGWAALAVLVASIAPAVVAIRGWRGGSTPLQAAESGQSRAARRLRETMVGLQVAVACLILFTAGFVLRTVVAAHTAKVGFRAEGLVIAQLDLYGQGAGAEKRAEVVRQVLSQLRDRREIREAAAASLMPLTHIRMPARVRDAAGASLPVFSNTVSDGYFDTLELPLERGRTFTPGKAGAGEAVVNRALADRLAPVGNVVGRTLDVLDATGHLRSRLHIVGVARDATYHTLWQDHLPYFYVSTEAGAIGNPAIIVRPRGSVDAAWSAIRETVLRVYPEAVVSAPSTSASQLAALVAEQSYLAGFFTSLAAIALIIAAGGLMANLYLAVSHRTREIGIRRALGGTRAGIVRTVLAPGLAVTAGGLALGLAIAGRLSEWLRPLAPGTPEGDLWPAVISCAVLVAVAAGSTLGPAMRAARVDPWRAIRHPE